MRLYNIPEKKIKVVYLGASNIYKPASAEDKERVKIKYHINEPYVLFVGAIEPKKNIELIIKAFHICQKNNPHLTLVIAGKKSWKFETIFQLVDSLNLKKSVIFLNFVPGEDLPALYSAAEVFLFPSRYEGFGLPVLEAMKCGTPVITSNVSSLPEIVGETGLMVNPDDYEKLAEKILKLISDRDFHSKYAHYSLERAKLFSWEKTCRETMEIYKEVLNSGM